jgi:SAM-dependent methyltransferase
MDDLANFNRQHWNDLVRAGIEYSRPFLDLDQDSARLALDPYHIMGDPAGKDVLCLAGGGGQQSAAFALLGAMVTVFDLSDAQLEKDHLTAEHYGLDLRIEQGDMRDLSRFSDSSFDLVFQPYSINFVPEAIRVIQESARVLRAKGLYRLDFANPFVFGIDETEWAGSGYPLRLPYQDGEVIFAEADWTVYDDQGRLKKVLGPRELRHTLSLMFNGLIAAGFTLLGLWEERGDCSAVPGSWEHYKAVAPPWFMTWWEKN